MTYIIFFYYLLLSTFTDTFFPTRSGKKPEQLLTSCAFTYLFLVIFIDFYGPSHFSFDALSAEGLTVPMSSNDLILSMGTSFRGAMDIIRGAMPKKEKQSTLALSILIHVDKSSGISQGELGRMLRRDPMTMSQAVRALQTSGLVVSQPDNEDRRVRRLTVTKKGKQLGETLLEGESRLLNGLSREWGKSRVNQFAKDVTEFNEFLSKSRP